MLDHALGLATGEAKRIAAFEKSRSRALVASHFRGAMPAANWADVNLPSM
jgi:hypothetical protein